jgi:hypothetical protein
MLPLRHEASTRTGAASPRKSCQSPPCQCYGFRLPVARVNPPCKTWRPGGVLGDDTQCQRMNPPCKTWRPGGVQCDDTRYQRMNPPCKTRRPRKSKTRTRDAIRPHNRKRRAPLPRATSIVTNSGDPQPGMRVSATPCNRRRLPRERRTSLPGAATVSPNKSGGRKPPVSTASGTATAHTAQPAVRSTATTRAPERKPPVGSGNRTCS